MIRKDLTAQILILARDCGFALAGVAPAAAVREHPFYLQWVKQGMAGQMGYPDGHRAEMRADPRLLFAPTRSVVVLGSFSQSAPEAAGDGQGFVSRYARGNDYHEILRGQVAEFRDRLATIAGPFESMVCVDTAPLLERSLGQAAGLGWIGRNTCLINEQMGSWFFLAELLTSLELEPGSSPPDRCGSCTRCITACPTQALVPVQDGAAGGEGLPEYQMDARRCISYLTIELKSSIPEDLRGKLGHHIFGCDICQEVCPWNSRHSEPAGTAGAGFPHPDLETAGRMTAEEFRAAYRSSPVWRTRHRRFVRNVVVAMGNSGDSRYAGVLGELAASDDELIREHATWALGQLPS